MLHYDILNFPPVEIYQYQEHSNIVCLCTITSLHITSLTNGRLCSLTNGRLCCRVNYFADVSCYREGLLFELSVTRSSYFYILFSIFNCMFHHSNI